LFQFRTIRTWGQSHQQFALERFEQQAGFALISYCHQLAGEGTLPGEAPGYFSRQ